MMAHIYFSKIGILVLLFITLFHASYLFSGTSETQSGLLFSTPSSCAETGKGTNRLVKFEDEFLKYTIGFWFLKKIGVLSLQCKREKETFTITIDGCTTGLIDKVLHRHNIYKTTMAFDKETKRLKPLNTYEKKIKGNKERVKIAHYDYAKNVHRFSIWRNGIFRREKEIKLDTLSNDDGITAFYNLRNESYGRVSDGAIFTIQTVHNERISESKISVRSLEDSDHLSRWKERSVLNAKLMAEITLDPEVLDSEHGKLEVLITDDCVPVGFVARDVVGFGDLYGVLEQP